MTCSPSSSPRCRPVGRVSGRSISAAEASPRLVALAAVSVAGLFGSILAGRPELVAVAAPFAVLLVAGIVLAESPDVPSRGHSTFDRVVAGDDIDVSVTITSSVPVSASRCRLPRRRFASVVEPADGVLTWATTVGRRPTSMTVRLRTSRWGVEAVGPARLELAGPLGIVRWSGTSADIAIVGCYRTTVRLENLLPNLEPRTASGAHVSRGAATGSSSRRSASTARAIACVRSTGTRALGGVSCGSTSVIPSVGRSRRARRHVRGPSLGRFCLASS